MKIRVTLRALSCAAAAILISCGQAAVVPSRIESDRDRAERAYAEADRLVSSVIMDTAHPPIRPVHFKEVRLERDLWIYQLDLYAMEDRGDALSDRWVAAVTVWTGSNPLNAYLQGSLRLYRREGGRVRFVGTTDDTPIIKAARSKEGLPGFGDLGASLSSAIDGIDFVASDSALGGWTVRARYSKTYGNYTYLGGPVCWLVRGDRFYPHEAQYSICAHDVGLRNQTWFVHDVDTVTIEKTVCLDPWLEAAALILEASNGKAEVARVLGMASPDDMKALARFRIWRMDFREDDYVCPWYVTKGGHDESCQVRFYVSRERPGMDFPEIGWLTLSLGGTEQQPTLKSFQFVANEVQPDWDSMK